MATNILENNSDHAVIEMTNGDLQALNAIKEKYNFKDIDGVIRFSLAVLTISQKGKLFHETPEGKTEWFEPMDDLVGGSK